VRRVATVAITAGVVVAAVAVPAAASGDTGFWHSAGLRGVDAFGVYRVRPAKVRLSFLLKDTRKDRYTAAVRLVFTEGHHRRSVRVMALPRVRTPERWRTAVSANTGHLYVQECAGRWRKKGFWVRKCGVRVRRY
jgi:hypothetical protein